MNEAKKYSKMIARILSIGVLTFGTILEIGELQAQTSQATEDVSETSAKMGIGRISRFATGAKPIVSERKQIVPGTPMEIDSTMKAMIDSGGGGNDRSFGGILSRYDKTQFGKFFATGTLENRTFDPNIEELTVGDNELTTVEETARMYPPRLYIDFSEYPAIDLQSQRAQKSTQNLLVNISKRFKLDPNSENIQLEYQDNRLILTGTVRSERLARTIESVLSFEPGVERVENRLEYPKSNVEHSELLNLLLP